MNELTFTFWLQGWVELNNGKMPDAAQWEMIKEHLALSFVKVTKPLEPTSSNNTFINPFPKPSEFTEQQYYPAFDPNKFWLEQMGTGMKPGQAYC